MKFLLESWKETVTVLEVDAGYKLLCVNYSKEKENQESDKYLLRTLNFKSRSHLDSIMKIEKDYMNFKYLQLKKMHIRLANQN